MRPCDAVRLLEPRAGGFGITLRYARRAVERLSGARLEAPLSGQRAMRVSTLRQLIPFAAGWGLEVGMTIDAIRSGLRVEEIDLPLRHRGTGRTPAGFLHRARQLRDIRARACAPDSVPLDDPGDRPGDHGEHVHRLRRRRAPAWPLVQRVRAALPEAGLGRARRFGDLGGDPPGRGRRPGGCCCPGLGSEGDRDHQPAGDRRGLGPERPASRSIAPSSGRTAGLRRAATSSANRATRC